MAERYFTLAEANALLAEVRPLAESLVEHRQGMRLAAERRARLTARIAGNGGDLDPQEPGELDEQFERESQAVAKAAASLQRLGVLVKDLDTGLLDFPALREGDEVELCWHVGEDAVAHWHELGAGYAGRKPIDWVE